MAANGQGDIGYNAIIDTWLATDFDGGRHQRRVDLMR
jgi:ribose 5-phosphate isomerase RpiB